jgi:2'-5' RNA ligase
MQDPKLQGHRVIYVLTYPEFEPRVAQRIDRFRAINEPERAKLVPPHITLVFGLHPANKENVETLSGAVASNTPELTVEFDRSEISYDPFEKKHKLFLICGKGDRAMIALHNQLYDGPHRSELNSEFPFEPHMTVATSAERADIEDLDLADIGQLPIIGTVRALEVVQLVDGTLNLLKTASLRA